MRTRQLRLIVSSFVLLTGCAREPAPPPATPTSAASSVPTPVASGHATELKAAGEAKVGDRTTCPTSGEEFVVTADSPKVEHEGKTYYFCCSGCDKKFAKDPEKFLKKPGA